MAKHAKQLITAQREVLRNTDFVGDLREDALPNELIHPFKMAVAFNFC